MLVAAVFELLLVFGDLGGSGALASIELSLKLRDEGVEGGLELVLGFLVGSISLGKLAEKVAVVGIAFTVSSAEEISLHLSEVGNLNGAEVSTEKNAKMLY